MHDERWFAIRIATDFPIDLLAVTDLEHPALVGLNHGGRLHAKILAYKQASDGQHASVTQR